MFLDGKELVGFKPLGGKPKTVCPVTDIIIVVTNTGKDRHQSVRVLVIELKISRLLSMCTAPSPFAYCLQELFGRSRLNL